MTANATQYQFELLEVAELLLKKNQITEGFWTVGVNFALTTAVAGPEADKARPSMIVAVDKIMLTRAEETTPLTVDASKLKK